MVACWCNGGMPDLWSNGSRVWLLVGTLSGGYYLDGWLSVDRWTIQVYNPYQGQLSLPSFWGK